MGPPITTSRDLLAGFIFALAGLSASAAPPQWKDFHEARDRAMELASKNDYAAARATADLYVTEHADIPEARRFVKQAKHGSRWYAELEDLWKRVQADPKQYIGKYVQALQRQNCRRFNTTPEERARALKLALEHDSRTQAIVSQQFPMNIRLTWKRSEHQKRFEKHLLARLRKHTDAAGVPVVTDGGRWTLALAPRFTFRKAGSASGFILSGDGFVLDDKDEQHLWWSVSGAKAITPGPETPADWFDAVDEFERTLVDRLTGFVLDQVAEPSE